MRHAHETEAEYEKRLHVEAEYEIAILLGEEPHARSRENVAALKPYIAKERPPLYALGWDRDFAKDRWLHESGAVIENHELTLLIRREDMYALAARRIQAALNKKAWAKAPLTPREIDALVPAPPEET